MPDNLHVKIDTALASVRNNRLGVNILEAGMVKDIATSLDGKVRFSILLSASDDATIVRDARQAVEQVPGVSEVRVDVKDAAQSAVQDAGKSVKNIKSIWIKNAEGMVKNNRIVAFRVNANITFEVE